VKENSVLETPALAQHMTLDRIPVGLNSFSETIRTVAKEYSYRSDRCEDRKLIDCKNIN